ncbi:hypothetical protein X975_23206, partial [Stegodyphus mimosarum]
MLLNSFSIKSHILCFSLLVTKSVNLFSIICRYFNTHSAKAAFSSELKFCFLISGMFVLIGFLKTEFKKEYLINNFLVSLIDFNYKINERQLFERIFLHIFKQGKYRQCFRSFRFDFMLCDQKEIQIFRCKLYPFFSIKIKKQMCR